MTAGLRGPASALLMLALVRGGQGAHPVAMARHARVPVAGCTASPAVENRIFSLLNADRSAHGVPPLVLSRQLTSVALTHSRDMGRRGYFSHDTPEGRGPGQRLLAAGIAFTIAGENLGMTQGVLPLRAATLIDASMMAEPPDQENHRAIILALQFRKVGIGACVTPGGGVYLTEDFTN
jgi:uncharacterized protein YkwD